MSEQPFLFDHSGPWIQVRDGNDTARSLFDRHYSRYRYRDGRKPRLFVGPGEKMVLLTRNCKAVFVWRKFISADRQEGINCAVFRNEESGFLPSDLIRAADLLADNRWPMKRHYTYINPRAVKSSNPGYCFIMAGWRKCGVTKQRKLLILERPGDIHD